MNHSREFRSYRCQTVVLRGLATAATFTLLLLASATAQETPDFCIFPYRCPTAARISPQVGQRGKQVTLLLQGARLQGNRGRPVLQSGIEVCRIQAAPYGA